MKRTRIFSALLAGALLFSLTACGGNSASSGSTGSTQSGSNAQSGSGQYREHLTIAVNAQITMLDPQKINNVQSNQLFNMVYNTLVNYDTDTKEVLPELATSWEWTDDSYTTLKLTLRDDVTFQNGVAFTADDVAFTLDRATYASLVESYDHCNVIDPYTIEICLKSPNVDFVDILSHNSTAIVSKENVEADEEFGGAIGTGPWKIDLENYSAGDTIELLRNDNYWDVLPETKSITIRYIGNASARLIALENDEVQVVTGIATSEMEIAKENPSITVKPFKTTTFYALTINTKNGAAANDQKLRTAIAYAINRDDIIQMIGDPDVEPATTVFGWQANYYFDDFTNDLSYNPEKAKELVSQCANTTVNLIVNGQDAKMKTIASAIQEQCRLVGITVNVEELDHVSVEARRSEGTHELVILSLALFDWPSDIGRILSSQSQYNYANLSDPQVDELLQLGVSTDDPEQRSQYYQQLQELVHDSCYYIPIAYGTHSIAYRNGVDGIVVRPNTSHDFSYACMLEG